MSSLNQLMKQFLTPGVLLLALLALLAPIQGDWLDGNDGVDRYGGNLPGTPTSMNSSSQPRDCALRCRSNPACKAWVFVKGNCGSSKDPMCQQKGAINPQSRNPCVVSVFNRFAFLFYECSVHLRDFSKYLVLTKAILLDRYFITCQHI